MSYYYGNSVNPAASVDPNSIASISTSTALSQASYGKTFIINASVAPTITLGALIPTDKAKFFTITNDSASVLVTVNASGSDVIRVNGVGVSSFSMIPGDIATLENNGATWSLVAQYNVGARYMTFANLPTTNIGPLVCTDMGGYLYLWTTSAYFTGYRNVLCGTMPQNFAATPRAWELPATGGTLTTSDPKQNRVISWFQEQGLTIASGSWITGQGKISDLGSGNWKMCDLQNMFLRNAGIDADTANPAPVGTYQADALQRITGTIQAVNNVPLGQGPTGALYAVTNLANLGRLVADTTTGVAYLGFDSGAVTRASVETRGSNTRVSPVILI